jgi:hypothetical protein
MPSERYINQSENLKKAIEIAIEVIKTNPPKGFTDQHVQLFIDTYIRVKKQIINAEPKLQTLTSLKYDIDTVFTFYNESVGETVNEFWKRIKKSGLPYERENKLKKILSKKKIKNQQEYDYVIDTMVPFKQEGVINSVEFELLNQLISDYEKKKR